MKKALKIMGNVVLVIALLGVGVVAMGGMISTRPKPETEALKVLPPYVQTMKVANGEVALAVRTHGTVTPRTEGTLVSEVSGRVVEVAPIYGAGGFFEEGDLLMKIDPRDYELAEIRARASLAACQAKRERIRAEAEVAAQEWASLGEGEAPPLALRKPQLAQAQAEVDAARAALNHAKVNLERTVIRAPYSGCVRAKIADMGQYVTVGTPLARIFAVDYAEVRLPLSDDQASRLELEAFHSNGEEGRIRPAVVLRGTSGGSKGEWSGEIVRVEGHVDARSRMTMVVVRVNDPYGLDSVSGPAPLSVGLFVEAETEGRVIEGVTVVPRTALREGGMVAVVDGEQRLRFRTIQKVQASGAEVVVKGLEDGESVCLTTPEVVTEGMKVRLDTEEAEVEAGARNSEVK
ncbi:MAG: efflux RND transporter periplasmic adaptor subunit [Planctomycetota bacterium]|jgi:RND family efflux transporter MFP subunit